MDIFQVDAAALFLISKDVLYISASSGKWEHWSGSPHPIGENEFKEILSLGHPYFINSPEEFAKTFKFHDVNDKPMSKMVSCALVPVHSENTPIGLLVLSNYSRKKPLETQTNLLATVAEIAGITIQRMKSMDAMEQLVTRRNNELSALYNVIATASQSKNIKDKLEIALGEVLRSLNCLHGSIFLYDWDENRLRCFASQQLPSNLKERIENSTLETSWEGWAILHDEALVISDISSDQRFIGMNHILDDQKLVYVGMPIKNNGKISGVLSILRMGTQVFSIDEISFIYALANHIGVIIENNSLIERVEKAALADERSRLARDLHDSVTQTLYSSTFFAETGLKMIEQGKLEQVKEYLAKLSQSSLQALKEMRLLIYQLRPEILKTEGLIPALRQRLELVENKVTIQTKLSVNEIRRLSDHIEDALYWIAIEALNNILKHAQASQVLIKIQMEEVRVILQIQDNGKGFEPLETTHINGLGLNNIRERLQKEGGSLEISSSKEQGTTLTIICPIEG